MKQLPGHFSWENILKEKHLYHVNFQEMVLNKAGRVALENTIFNIQLYFIEGKV